jgi:hypothetical protein
MRTARAVQFTLVNTHSRADAPETDSSLYHDISFLPCVRGHSLGGLIQNARQEPITLGRGNVHQIHRRSDVGCESTLTLCDDGCRVFEHEGLYCPRVTRHTHTHTHTLTHSHTYIHTHAHTQHSHTHTHTHTHPHTHTHTQHTHTHTLKRASRPGTVHVTSVMPRSSNSYKGVQGVSDVSVIHING